MKIEPLQVKCHNDTLCGFYSSYKSDMMTHKKSI